MKARRFPLLFGAGLLAILAATAVPAGAQDVTVEVKTWTGQSLRLTQPSLEVSYTILPQPKNGEPGGLPPERSEVPTTTGAAGQGGGGPRIFGTAQELQKGFEKGPEPVRGQRDNDHLTMSRDGVQMQVPFARLASLQITRQLVTSSLPPHAAAQHYRYAVSAALVDGSSIQGDYINFGTTLLRGMSSHGRVAIPLEEIESLRLER